MPPLLIRCAVIDDLEDLQLLAEKTFRETFSPQNSASDMDLYVEQSLSVDRLRRELGEVDSPFFLAFDQEKESWVGYGRLRSGIADPQVRGKRAVEIERLYVDQKAIGKGAGASLLIRLLEEARLRAFDSAWLGVWEHNQRAIDFYRKFGFEKVGTHGFLLGEDLQTDWIMERRL